MTRERLNELRRLNVNRFGRVDVGEVEQIDELIMEVERCWTRISLNEANTAYLKAHISNAVEAALKVRAHGLTPERKR